MALAASVQPAHAGIAVSKLHPHVGAEITGVDLRRPLGDASFEIIREAWHEHSVLVLRDQRIDDDRQVEYDAGTSGSCSPCRVVGGDCRRAGEA